MAINLSDKETTSLMWQVWNWGFLTERALRNCTTVSPGGPFAVGSECQSFTKSLLMKLLEKSPLTYSLVRVLSDLSQRRMMRLPFSYMLQKKRVWKLDDHQINLQFLKSKFIDSIYSSGSDDFQRFDRKKACLDGFLLWRMAGDEYKYDKIISVIRMLLELSHGQDTTECGLSINKTKIWEPGWVGCSSACDMW